MPSTNVDKVRRFYPAEHLDLAEMLRRPDAAEALESRFGDIFHEDFETVDHSGTVTPTERGMRGFVEAWLEWFSSFETWRVAADGFTERGSKVLVSLDIIARSMTDGVEMPSRGANVVVFRGGRIARVEAYTDVAAARRAFDLD